MLSAIKAAGADPLFLIFSAVLRLSDICFSLLAKYFLGPPTKPIHSSFFQGGQSSGLI